LGFVFGRQLGLWNFLERGISMKKEIFMVLCVTSVLLFCVNLSLAQDIEGKFGIGARIAYVNYSDDDYVVHGVKVDTEPDDATMYGMNLTYFFHRYASFELSVDYTEADVELSALGLSGDAGEITQVPVLLTLRMHFSTNPKVSPYIGGGVGYYFNSFDTNRTVAEFIYGPGADIEVDDSFGYHVSGGIEYFVTDNAAINVDVKYIWQEVEAGVNVPGFTDEEFDIDTFVAGAGFKYYF
jgi:outer membrane protein